ncbi:MAG: CBS domain-containing protein [Desulfobacteraceae bacterium]|nr:CBS domain-containing protein [Desulfobacteraceae bacterium]
MKDLRAADVMATPVVSAGRKTFAKNLALLLLSGQYSGMPIVDEQSQVVGIITEIDILEAIHAGKDLEKTTAEDLMSQNARVVDVDTQVTDIMAIMKDQNIIRVPVTKDGKLVGIVARRDILRSYVAPFKVVIL